jgi:hypothetical protein
MGGGASKSKESKYKEETSSSPPARTSIIDKGPEGEAPDFLECPLSYEIMRDPVFTCDGHTFERHVIEEWLRDHDTNPMTNLKMESKNLIPNFAIREACAAYRSKNPSNVESIKRYNEAVAKVKKLPPTKTTPSSTATSSNSNNSNTTSYLNGNNFNTTPSITTNTNTTRRQQSFDFAAYDTSPTNNTSHHHQPQHYPQPSYSTTPTPTPTNGNSTQCSLCTNQATTKTKIGPNEYIKVCDGCSQVVVAQRNNAGTESPSSSRFRTVSASEAAQNALTASVSPTSSGVATSRSNIHRHASSLVGTNNVTNVSGRNGSVGNGGSRGSSGSGGSGSGSGSGSGGSGTMACAHCRQQAVCSRATDIDGSILWLCPGCGDTQRQFSQAHIAATTPTHGSNTTTLNNTATNYTASTSTATTPVHRRQTYNGTSHNDRGLYLENALGGSSGTPMNRVIPAATSPQACHNRAWDRAEAMALLEQHEWSNANTSSANAMADEMNDRYADTIQRGRNGGRNSMPIVSNNGGHPVNCLCGLCARR